MDELVSDPYDKRTLQKIISEQFRNHALFDHLRGNQKINLAPFLENPYGYLNHLPKKDLLTKCLNDLRRLRKYYLLLPNAKETVEGFIADMTVGGGGKSGISRYPMAFSYYRKAVFQLTNIYHPVRGRLEALKLYAAANAQLQIVGLLREERLGGRLKIADGFMKKDKARDAYIRGLLKDNPDAMYKSLWCDADIGIIGKITLRTFENHCSRIKKEMLERKLKYANHASNREKK